MKSRKRQALVNTDRCALMLEPQPVDVQDRDGAGVVSAIQLIIHNVVHSVYFTAERKTNLKRRCTAC